MYQKVKTVSKVITPRSPALTEKILETMAKISAIVGATLGPGGQPVLIEREEHGIPATVTKDGVTVYRALGFTDPISHAILETARDASVRTASEAGDGTTTATILSEAIIRNTLAYIKANPRMSPQRVVRKLQSFVSEQLIPLLKAVAIRVDSTSDEGRRLMYDIAKTSANGDSDLADAVLECFDITGDEGNVTIIESSGPPHYEVERIAGYPIPMGYEDSMGRFYSRFLNDSANQRVLLDNPVFLLYDGKITEIQTILPALETLSQAYTTLRFNHNVVVVAHGFSESVLGHLAYNFGEPNTIKIVPIMVPMSIQLNGQTQFLHDLAAVVGAKVFDPLNSPVEFHDLMTDFGPTTDTTEEGGGPQLRSFGPSHLEMSRFRSTLVGIPENDETSERCINRIDALKQQKGQDGVSTLDAMLIQERIARLSGGIARLKCFGSSNGELKEKRDRAEDAVCAVRGALKHGALPGEAWAFQFLAAAALSAQDPTGALDGILVPSLQEPLSRLFENAGFSLVAPSDSEASDVAKAMEYVISNAATIYSMQDESIASAMIVDMDTGTGINAMDAGVVDSLPAVLEALRNSVSIASLLGSLGGTVVYHRDAELERTEARAAATFERHSNMESAANERA